MRLRNEVRQFAELMEARLRAHDEDRGERGWADERCEWLSARLVQECGELLEALAEGDDEAAVEECADVANLAMMIADVQGALPEDEKEHQLDETTKEKIARSAANNFTLYGAAERAIEMVLDELRDRR